MVVRSRGQVSTIETIPRLGPVESMTNRSGSKEAGLTARRRDSFGRCPGNYPVSVCKVQAQSDDASPTFRRVVAGGEWTIRAIYGFRPVVYRYRALRALTPK
jgi:hypothetical protein